MQDILVEGNSRKLKAGHLIQVMSGISRISQLCPDKGSPLTVAKEGCLTFWYIFLEFLGKGQLLCIVSIMVVHGTGQK